MLFTERLVLHDLEPLKIRGVRPDLKKGFEHIHIEGFPKAARSCKQVDSAP